MSPRTPLVRPRQYVESRSSVLASGLGVFVLHVPGVYVFLVNTMRLLLTQVENGPGLAGVPGSLVTIRC